MEALSLDCLILAIRLTLDLHPLDIAHVEHMPRKKPPIRRFLFEMSGELILL